MDELRVEIALEIIQSKITNYIKNYQGNDKEEFIKDLKVLIEERKQIHKLNEEVINKVYDVYLKDVKEEG